MIQAERGQISHGSLFCGRLCSNEADSLEGKVASKMDSLEKKVDEQKEQLEDSERRVREMAIDHRRSKNVADDVETIEEKQFIAQGLRETSANVLYTLGQLGREFPEMRDTLNEALKAQGLQVPARPPSRVMSRGSSRASRRTDSRGGNMGSRGGGGLEQEFKNEF